MIHTYLELGQRIGGSDGPDEGGSSKAAKQSESTQLTYCASNSLHNKICPAESSTDTAHTDDLARLTAVAERPSAPDADQGCKRSLNYLAQINYNSIFPSPMSAVM